MGTFRVEIQAVGGHGCQREVKDGEKVEEFCGNEYCPDCAARKFVKNLKKHYNSIESAELIHWPGTPDEVRDNLLTGIRKGSF